jgi:D-arabinose 1-dehydrogenase-like Zn-dependent alcohol dehydrogenase
MNIICIETWESVTHQLVSMEDALWVTYGILSGPRHYLQSLYTAQIKLMGSTNGTRRETTRSYRYRSPTEINVKVWKKIKLDNVKEAEFF